MDNVLVTVGGTTGDCTPEMLLNDKILLYPIQKTPKPIDLKIHYFNDHVYLEWKHIYSSLKYVVEYRQNINQQWNQGLITTSQNLKIGTSYELDTSFENTYIKLTCYPQLLKRSDVTESDDLVVKILSLNAISNLSSKLTIDTKNGLVLSWLESNSSQYELYFRTTSSSKTTNSSWHSLPTLKTPLKITNQMLKNITRISDDDEIQFKFVNIIQELYTTEQKTEPILMGVVVGDLGQDVVEEEVLGGVSRPRNKEISDGVKQGLDKKLSEGEIIEEKMVIKVSEDEIFETKMVNKMSEDEIFESEMVVDVASKQETTGKGDLITKQGVRVDQDIDMEVDEEVFIIY